MKEVWLSCRLDDDVLLDFFSTIFFMFRVEFSSLSSSKLWLGQSAWLHTFSLQFLGSGEDSSRWQPQQSMEVRNYFFLFLILYVIFHLINDIDMHPTWSTAWAYEATAMKGFRIENIICLLGSSICSHDQNFSPPICVLVDSFIFLSTLKPGVWFVHPNP